MEFGDLLLKIAQNQQLSPQELDAIKRFGTETQARNSQVVGMQNGSINLSVNNLMANSVAVGKNIISGYSCKFISSINPASGVLTEATSWSADYNDGFPVSGGTITIPKTGVYNVILTGSFDNYVIDKDIYITTVLNGVATFPAANGSSASLFTSVRDGLYQAGDQVKVRCIQYTGATLAGYLGITFREVRSGY